MQKNTKAKKFKVNRQTWFRFMCILLVILMLLPLIATAVGMMV